MGLVSSMTGYGRGEALGERLAVLAEARSVNHRFLEIAVKLPRGLASHEPEVRRRVQGRIARGRVDVTATTRRLGGSLAAVRTDTALGAEYARGARALAAAAGLAPELTVADVLRLPGVVTVEEVQDEESQGGPLLGVAVEAALDGLCRMRQAEGATLARDLGSHLTALEAWRVSLAAILPAALARIQGRYQERVRAILGEAPVDPGRLAQEVATWAARADVAEELARLDSHQRQAVARLAAGGAIGRQLDFLAQELHREVNTIAAKADDAEMIERLLEVRTLVERIREQVQNVE
jgi:uncharacterized protein (TIGR00255 family)